MQATTIITMFTVLSIFTGCSPSLPKEERLINSINGMVQAAEKRSLSQIMNYISNDYQDEKGWKYIDVKRVLQIQIMRYKSLYIFKDIKNIEWLSEKTAQLKINIAVAAKPIKEISLLKNIKADLITFIIIMEQKEDQYVVTSASWERAGVTDFL